MPGPVLCAPQHLYKLQLVMTLRSVRVNMGLIFTMDVEYSLPAGILLFRSFVVNWRSIRRRLLAEVVQHHSQSGSRHSTGREEACSRA